MTATNNEVLNLQANILKLWSEDPKQKERVAAIFSLKGDVLLELRKTFSLIDDYSDEQLDNIFANWLLKNEPLLRLANYINKELYNKDKKYLVFTFFNNSTHLSDTANHLLDVHLDEYAKGLSSLVTFQTQGIIDRGKVLTNKKTTLGRIYSDIKNFENEHNIGSSRITPVLTQILMRDPGSKF